MAGRHRREDGANRGSKLPESVEQLEKDAEQEAARAKDNHEGLGGGDYSAGQIQDPHITP